MPNFPYFVVILGLVAALLSWGLVALLVRYAPRLGLLDVPNDRSMHAQVTPRGGGLGFVVVVALVLAGILVLGLPGTVGAGRSLSLGIYLVAALFIAAVSLRDDFKSLSPGMRFLCQLLAGSVAAAGIASFRQCLIPGWGVIDLRWTGVVVTFVWIVGLTNVYNFMDGINGIAGVQGVTAGLAWAWAGFVLGSPLIALLGLLLAGGCAGFLFHNWTPAKIFMGDVGSAFLGYSFAVLPLLLQREAPADTLPVFALLVVWPFVGDGFYTFLRRAWLRETVWTPHRSHLYQRLVRCGWTHARVSSIYAGWCALSAVTAGCWLGGVTGAGIAVLLLPPLTLAAIVLLVKHREKVTGVWR